MHMRDCQRNAGFVAGLTAIFAEAMLGLVAGIVGGVAGGTMAQNIEERREGEEEGDVAYARKSREKGKATGVRKIDDRKQSMNRMGLQARALDA